MFLMKEKKQVTYILRKFLLMAKNQFNRAVKLIRSDNELKFISSCVQTMFDDFGILHQKNCTYTPQQYGVVERRHMMILQIARALLFQSGLHTEFWGEAILHATYLLNRLPSPRINWETPYKILYKKEAMY